MVSWVHSCTGTQEKLSAAEIKIRKGRKWEANEAPEVVEPKQRQREFVGNVDQRQHGQSGNWYSSEASCRLLKSNF